MRHRKATIKLNRTSSHRKAMFRNMVTSLFKYERIRTTDPKAKELKKWADNLITLAKRGDLHARRQALSIIREKDIVHKLFKSASEHYADTNGGYTRITKIGRRPGDAALMSMVELVIPGGDKPKKKSTKKKAKSVEKAEADVTVDETPEDPTDQTAAEAAPESDTVAEESDETAAESEPDPKLAEEMEKEEEETEAETSEDQTDEEKSEG